MPRTRYGEYHRDFLDMETDLDLFSFTLDGVRIWEWIRYDVFQRALFDTGIWHHHEPLGHGFEDQLRGAYLWARNAVEKNPFLSPQSRLLYWGHPRRKYEDDGYWWDIYCDPIHEEFDLEYLHVEEPFLNAHFTPARTRNIRYLDLIHYTGTLREMLGLTSGSASPDERRTLEAVETRIRADVGADVDVTSLALSKLRRRNTTIGLYDRFLRRVDPDLVVLVAGSGRETFIEACKNRGVPVAELQHGHMSQQSIEYSFPGDRRKRTFPDYLLTFGEFWNGTGAYPTAPENVVAVGFPYLERRLQKYADVERTDQILFMSQWNISPPLSKFAVEVADSPEVEQNVVFKLHPDEFEGWEDHYPWLADSAVDVVGPDGADLHRLLAESSVQVGVYSTTIFEGLAFGLDTYLAELPGVENMTPLLERGDATLVESPSHLVAELDVREGPSGPSTQYFEDDALTKVTSTIERLLAETRT